MFTRHMQDLAPVTDGVQGDYGKHVQNPKTPTAEQIHPLGFSMVLRGTVYYYGLIGGLTVARNLVVQSSLPQTNHQNESVAADAAVGAITVQMTDGGTGVVANEYNDGFLHINNDAGQGQYGRIASHTVAASGTTVTFTLEPEFALDAAITTASEVTVTRHPYWGMIITPTTLTAPVAGITPVSMTDAYYGWVATWGPFSVLVDSSDSVTIGNVVTAPAGSAADEGTVGVATGSVLPRVGIVMQPNAATEYALIDLRIRPYVPYRI